MNISFQNAKNGELTAVIDEMFIHSSYNPSKEAKRFVDNIKVSYIPKLIILLEPAISYVVPFLKERFSEAEILIIRYTDKFNSFNNSSYVFNYYEHKDDFENYIFNALGEEKLFGALILQWQPTSKVFQKEESSVLLILKSLMEKSKTLLVTREYFEKKWFINSCNFIKYVNHPVVLNRKINIPIVIVSSGPSLRDALPVIKMYRNRIFVLCLSSAIKVCISNDIIPDLCMSTDGGFWAGEHLKSLYLNDIPLALALEGFCPKALLGSHKILPLVYNDNISHEIALKTKLPFMHGERNGTVSGTALVFALENSTGSVYICGMDMSNQRGYQHCQPNEIELDNSVKDYKLKSREQRISQSEYSKGVLSIYREWFDSFELKNRKVYRIINKEYKKNKLGYIKDINTYDFKNELSLINKDSGKNDYFNEARYRKDLLSLKEYLRILMESDQWKKNIFPLSMTSLRHNPDNADIVNRLEKEQSNLFRKIENIF